MQAYIKGTAGPKVEMVRTVRRVPFKRGKTLSGVDYIRRLDRNVDGKVSKRNLMSLLSISVILIEMVTVIFQMKKRLRDRLRLVNEGQGECRDSEIYLKNRM